MHLQRPARRESITSKTIGKETLLYDFDKGKVHILNPTAQKIWDLCNGRHTVNDIHITLRTHFDMPVDRNLVIDIEKTLSAFHEKGLLH